MSPTEVAHAVRLRLAAEVRQDLGAIERRAASVASLRTVPGELPREAVVRSLALAFELERIYTAIESLFTRVLQTLDGDVPAGHNWHAELLRAASVEVAGVRPALVSRECSAELRDLLGFRHVARHAYDVEPDGVRLEVLAERVARILPELRASLTTLVEELSRT